MNVGVVSRHLILGTRTQCVPYRAVVGSGRCQQMMASDFTGGSGLPLAVPSAFLGGGRRDNRHFGGSSFSVPRHGGEERGKLLMDTGNRVSK